MSLKQKLKKTDNLAEKVKILQNSFEGQDCYIMTCGPSLNEVEKEVLDTKLKDKLVLTVKQAYDRHPEISTFHFFNCCNLPVKDHKFCHYDYSENETIGIASSNYPAGMRWSPYQEYDIFFKVPIRTESDNEFICRTKNFDKFLLSNQIKRPSGPGIMLETVIFMAVHLGVKNIYALGWDLNKDNIETVEEYDHFFGSTLKLLNRGDMLDWEIKETRDCVLDIYQWLKTKDINLHLISNQSAISQTVPRVSLEESLNE